jgi:hypothetical protein
MRKLKVEQYVPTIEDDVPIPEHAATVYNRKIVDGELQRIANQIKPGQSVVLPGGSLSKFRKIVKDRRLKTFSRAVSRGGSKMAYTYTNTDGEARVWVLPGAATYIAERRRTNTVEIKGTPVNLTKISDSTGVDLGYLSRIFSGQSKGSIRTMRLIARTLGMTMEGFIDSLPGKSRSRGSKGE